MRISRVIIQYTCIRVRRRLETPHHFHSRSGGNVGHYIVSKVEPLFRWKSRVTTPLDFRFARSNARCDRHTVICDESDREGAARKNAPRRDDLNVTHLPRSDGFGFASRLPNCSDFSALSQVTSFVFRNGRDVHKHRNTRLLFNDELCDFYRIFGEQTGRLRASATEKE